MPAYSRARIRCLTLGLVLPALVACASYQKQTEDFRTKLYQGRAAEAAEKVKDKAFKEGDDQVVYLFEYGTAQQMAGNYAESNKAFLRAEDLTEIKDYHSVSRITGSLLLNEGMVQYKGDDFEKVLLNGMLAINYLMLGQLDEAQVETRKLNDKLYKYRFEGKRNYQQNPFAFYLSALIWEAEHNWDSAYIDFKKAYDLNPNMEYLHEDLIRAGIAARRGEDVAMWRKKWPDVKPADLKNNGEVVLIYQQGWGPRKEPNPAFPRVPKLFPSASYTTRARLEVDGGKSEISQTAANISEIATKQLDEQYSTLIAMRVAGIATKAVVADQIRQKNKLLGDLAWIAANAMDRADLRQWSSLPASFQVAKLRLKPGKYRIRAVGINMGGEPTSEQTGWLDVEVKPRKKQFIYFRTVH